MTTRPPPSRLIRPPWTAAVQTDESVVYGPEPHTVPIDPFAGHLYAIRLPACSSYSSAVVYQSTSDFSASAATDWPPLAVGPPVWLAPESPPLGRLSTYATPPATASSTTIAAATSTTVRLPRLPLGGA